MRLDKVTGDVSRRAKKRGVAKRQQTGKAQQQVEGAGKQCKAQQLHDKNRVEPEHGCHERQDQQRDVGDSKEFC